MPCCLLRVVGINGGRSGAALLKNLPKKLLITNFDSFYFILLLQKSDLCFYIGCCSLDPPLGVAPRNSKWGGGGLELIALLD